MWCRQEEGTMARDDDEAAELARIERRLALLPGTTRTVFLLARLDGLSNEQIAWRLGLDTKRVERHLARALLTLTWGPRRRWRWWLREDDDPS
jgi:DNA-directed RNA polymerase specialized sigma24 family protein